MFNWIGLQYKTKEKSKPTISCASEGVSKQRQGLLGTAFWNQAGYNAPTHLSELVFKGGSRLKIKTKPVLIPQEQVPLYGHVQLPKAMSRGPSEERLQR